LRPRQYRPRAIPPAPRGEGSGKYRKIGKDRPSHRSIPTRLKAKRSRVFFRGFGCRLKSWDRGPHPGPPRRLRGAVPPAKPTGFELRRQTPAVPWTSLAAPIRSSRIAHQRAVGPGIVGVPPCACLGVRSGFERAAPRISSSPPAPSTISAFRVMN